MPGLIPKLSRPPAAIIGVTPPQDLPRQIRSKYSNLA